MRLDFGVDNFGGSVLAQAGTNTSQGGETASASSIHKLGSDSKRECYAEQPRHNASRSFLLNKYIFKPTEEAWGIPAIRGTT